ncbi:hypothetical protein MUK42_05205 [Musa troglodytarum]|uniref:GRF-type domain-containing protein n=1 Tax=Musa troglodytarum TaxID=320322 RepID=A0A9E7ERA8_9LILI|nr:hypothetical protein MUK42_05205 [Musa troglodytarum]URD82541.1 hypothetical protein MUK42_05205 [Musa troglodytarum]URD82543.1 hypothetical protein MUK42_05205 [Musa troglodytarum]
MSSDGKHNLFRALEGHGFLGNHDPAAKEKTKGIHEGFLGYPKHNASHSNSQESWNVLLEPKDEMGVPVCDSTKANYSILEPYAISNKGYGASLYKQEAFTQPPDFVMWQQVQLSASANNIYPIIRDYSIPVEGGCSNMPLVTMFPHAHQHKVQIQEFQYFVVIDFEATCDKDRKLHPQEIIEFPSVLVNCATGQLEAVFQTYVRPSYHKHLTDYCKQLTGIQQFQVDRGVLLSEALIMHDEWLESKGIKHKTFAVVTWGDWDCRVMLESECKLKRIRKPAYFNRWINLKVPFQEMFQGIRCGLKDAVEHVGLTWEGRAHCGLDDARNTARLLVHLMDMGFKFSITKSLESQSIDVPMKHKASCDFLSDQAEHIREPKEVFGAPVQIHPFMGSSGKEKHTYCYCGVLSSKSVVRKPGPNQGRCFYGCGNWTAARRAVCNYFVWASP